MILLDTHALVWFAEDNPLLGRNACRLADSALRRDELVVAAISFWEIAMLLEKRRLTLELSPIAMRRVALAQGIREIPIGGEIAIAAVALGGLHGDPADRMIVATCLAVGAALITADVAILRWRGPLQTHDARR